MGPRAKLMNFRMGNPPHPTLTKSGVRVGEGPRGEAKHFVGMARFTGEASNTPFPTLVVRAHSKTMPSYRKKIRVQSSLHKLAEFCDLFENGYS